MKNVGIYNFNTTQPIFDRKLLVLIYFDNFINFMYFSINLLRTIVENYSNLCQGNVKHYHFTALEHDRIHETRCIDKDVHLLSNHLSYFIHIIATTA